MTIIKWMCETSNLLTNDFRLLLLFSNFHKINPDLFIFYFSSSKDMYIGTEKEK